MKPIIFTWAGTEDLAANLRHLMNTTTYGPYDLRHRWLYTKDDVIDLLKDVKSGILVTRRMLGKKMHAKSAYCFVTDAFKELKEIYLVGKTPQERIISTKKHGAALICVAYPLLRAIEKLGHAGALQQTNALVDELIQWVQESEDCDDVDQPLISYTVLDQARDRNRDALSMRPMISTLDIQLD